MSSLFTFLLVVHAIVAASLVGVILMQRSEGGGFTGGGSPAGLMTARGAADFLTRATTVLAFLFVILSIGLAALAASNRNAKELDTSLAKEAPAAPSSGVPLITAPTAGNETAPVEAAPQSSAPVPLAVQTPTAKPDVKVEKPVARTTPADKPRADATKPAAATPAPAPVPVAAPALAPAPAEAPATGN